MHKSFVLNWTISHSLTKIKLISFDPWLTFNDVIIGHVLRSCPELDKDTSAVGAYFSDLHQAEFSSLGLTNTMEKNISRSAHTIKVLWNFTPISLFIMIIALFPAPNSSMGGIYCIFNFTFIESCQSKMRIGFTRVFINLIFSPSIARCLISPRIISPPPQHIGEHPRDVPRRKLHDRKDWQVKVCKVCTMEVITIILVTVVAKWTSATVLVTIWTRTTVGLDRNWRRMIAQNQTGCSTQLITGTVQDSYIKWCSQIMLYISRKS